MLNELRFAIYAIKKNFQSSVELRTSFLMNVLGMVINNVSFIILWVFFVNSVGVIGGWTAIDIVGLQGFSALSYGIFFLMASGIDKLPDYVASGSFDRYMLSPKNLLVRIATSNLRVSAVGDSLFGVICLFIFGIVIKMSIYQIIMILILIITATIVFMSFEILIKSVGFYLVDAGYISDGLFLMLINPSMFHGGAFQGVMRFIFTFIIPSLLIGTLPIETIRNFSIEKILLIALLSLFWFLLSIFVFNKAVKRYESSNFMTFGN